MLLHSVIVSIYLHAADVTDIVFVLCEGKVETNSLYYLHNINTLNCTAPQYLYCVGTQSKASLGFSQKSN